MDKYFHPTLHNGCNYLWVLELKLKHITKRGCRSINIQYPYRTKPLFQLKFSSTPRTPVIYQSVQPNTHLYSLWPHSQPSFDSLKTDTAVHWTRINKKISYNFKRYTNYYKKVSCLYVYNAPQFYSVLWKCLFYIEYSVLKDLYIQNVYNDLFILILLHLKSFYFI